MHRRAVLITPQATILAAGPGATPDIATTPVDAFEGGPAGLADRVARLFDGHGVVLLTGPAAELLQLDENGWRTFGTNPKIYMGRLDRMPVGEPLVHPGCIYDTVTSFALYHEIMGVPYHRSAGVAGLSLLDALYPKGKTKRIDWKSRGPADAFEAPYFVTDWSRVPDAAYLHSFDKRRSGLGALGVVQVARLELTHRPNQRTFDPKMGGWWKCEIPAWNDGRMPNPAGYGDELRWLTHDTIILLNELAEQGRSAGIRHIHGSWTAPKSRLFEQWAKRVETAYQKAARMAESLDPDRTPSALGQDASRVVKAIKSTYKETAGMFASESSWAARPDWFAAKVALERANAWRAADAVGQQTGRWPVGVEGDRWTYASNEPDAEQAAPTWVASDGITRGIVLGDRLGQWRVESSRKAKR